MKRLLLNIYNKQTGREILGTVSSFEEFLFIDFQGMFSECLTYTEYLERVKEKIKKWYYFEDARGQN